MHFGASGERRPSEIISSILKKAGKTDSGQGIHASDLSLRQMKTQGLTSF